MKKIFLYTIAISSIGALAGCNKFLDKEPDSRAKLTTVEKVSQLLGTAYPQSNYQAFAESMSDNVNDQGIGDADLTVKNPYYFEEPTTTDLDSPEAYWFACYKAIAAANQALQTISQVSNPADYKNQKGEALVARAYSHFMLVTFFAHFYDASTAASDLGIPYVTEPETEVIKQYERKTVKYVYDMIEKDLLEGLPMIQDKAYKVPKYHFNIAAANAFAARFYLFKKDYAKVIQYCTSAVPATNFTGSLRPWNTGYKNITDVTELFRIYAKATENANLLLVETGSLWSRLYYGSRYCMDAAKKDRILPRPDSVTGGIFAYSLYSVMEQTHYLIPKIDEYFVRVSVDANFGDPYVMVPLFTTEEVVFNRIESQAYTGDTINALAALNAYVSTRINNYSATTHNITFAKLNTVFKTGIAKDGLIRAVLYYKRADFVHEGQRWFDILRYKMTVAHSTKNGPTINTLTADDPRKVLQLPPVTIAAGLERNPR